MAKFESSIRRARSVLVVLAASACLQWAATPAQAQEDLCGVVPDGEFDAVTDDACMRPLVVCNIQGCPEVRSNFPPFAVVCPAIPSISQVMEVSFLAEMTQEWGPFPLGSGPYCSKAVLNFVKVCRTVVTSSVGCVAHQIDGLARQDEEACKAFAGSEAKACAASVDEAAQAYLQQLTDAQATAQAGCTSATGNHFFRKCLYNVP